MNHQMKIAGVLGATSLVGQVLLPRLLDEGWTVIAYSRRHPLPLATSGVRWRKPTRDAIRHDGGERAIRYWVCAAPIWVLPDYFPYLKSCGAEKIVAVSSTSIRVKETSGDAGERQIAARLAQGEKKLAVWAASQNVKYAILRPTLIYGYGLDANVSAIARFIQAFSFFPLAGPACGLRQPVHADDVVQACLSALTSETADERVYHISGGDTLTYREMVSRIFFALGKKEHYLHLPAWLPAAVLRLLRPAGLLRRYSPAMIGRMNADLVFDHDAARRDLGFSPRPFRPCREDVHSGSSRGEASR
ncbi:MAG: NAD(P)-dependent oxidoreductase [Smithellaceae bacterium]